MEELANVGIAYLTQLADGGAAWAVIVMYVLGGLGAASVIASMVIKMTPSKKDDEWLKKLKREA